MKLYTLHTNAPYAIVNRVATGVAMYTGRMAILNEHPTGAIVIVPRRVWTRRRWIAVVLTLAAAPFAFRYLNVTALQGFGIGWITAVIVLLARRS